MTAVATLAIMVGCSGTVDPSPSANAGGGSTAVGGSVAAGRTEVGGNSLNPSGGQVAATVESSKEPPTMDGFGIADV